MKMKLVLAALLIILINTGSSCINDSILIAVNLPIKHTWPINGGNNVNFTGAATTISLAQQIDASYSEDIQKARYYDIRVSVGGDYSGVVTGTAYINNTPLLTFSGSWTDFQTPQSLLGSSTHITPQPAGVVVLVNSLNTFASNPGTVVTLSANGTLSHAPVPDGLTLTVEILAQVDAEVGGGE
ncbi:MAG: hypothetical protein H6Q30_568 [Bacteroidetes bacterium]|nr:hypothetical protein [Bacteroidota bacterium]